MTKLVIPGNLPSAPKGARNGRQGHTMKTIASTVLDPSRRSSDARDFEAGLRRKIVGQDAALEKVVEIYQMFLAGLNAPNRPVGNLLFLGPTGSGKTRVVEALAETLFGDARPCIKIDCAEFQHSHEIAKLIGSPPGYLGHRETHPLLTQEALNQWHTDRLKLSVVLFDEIEKASDALWSLLLGILDKAVLTLGDNSRVDFSKVIIIMTSNLGAKQMEEEVNGRIGYAIAAAAEEVDQAKLEKIGKDAAKRKFTPEFMNRLQNICVFQTLTRAQMVEVLDLELAVMQFRLFTNSPTKMFFHVLAPAKKRLMDEGYSPVYGARYLQRALDRLILIPLAKLVASGQIIDRDNILINEVGEDAFEFTLEERNFRLT